MSSNPQSMRRSADALHGSLLGGRQVVILRVAQEVHLVEEHSIVALRKTKCLPRLLPAYSALSIFIPTFALQYLNGCRMQQLPAT
jgi:hypothetical protein